jgi:hypothetical protein
MIFRTPKASTFASLLRSGPVGRDDDSDWVNCSKQYQRIAEGGHGRLGPKPSEIR